MISKKTNHLSHPIQRFFCKKVVDGLDGKDFLDESKYASKIPFTKELWSFIFQELLWKFEEENKLGEIKTISLDKGAYVLQEQHGGEVNEKLQTNYMKCYL